ncbi:DUF2490 domain-containing protein [Flammeovirga yaeyamensis]|uniref:DUF2490 domain-containing protein n=1 Tax=Flammeovirga yaeyamensis TaxID=367791 RepID=A0AAX1NA83_9BACT|nr:DUF2490 domain-containing protein [Flammeovirga yaeyamensis]MBB3697764.1 hypothetical protein [Flammeovirga yaeyamensis]NMF35880.1 DUF2490 domain-containing protein [Flammeovirga yaeyamensis]QWG03170.1 DUF2490 domain-containing protein [Flammeovirga yaeyamensis]
MLRKLQALFILLSISSFSLFAQEGPEVNLEETGLWEGVYIKVRFSEKFGYYGEHHYRSRNAIDNVNSFVGRPRQIYNRAGLNIFFNDYFEAVIGPTYVVNYTPEPGNDEEYEPFTNEFRIWHQWLFKMPAMGRVKMYHQFRFEHRWKRKNDIGAEYDYTNRYRYKVFAYIPVNKPKIEKGSIFVSPSAEIFMHSGESIAYNPFEDFRTYNGVGYVINNSFTLFAGHMWTIGQKTSGYQYRTSHIFRINVFIGLDTRKGDAIPKINLGY